MPMLSGTREGRRKSSTCTRSGRFSTSSIHLGSSHSLLHLQLYRYRLPQIFLDVFSVNVKTYNRGGFFFIPNAIFRMTMLSRKCGIYLGARVIFHPGSRRSRHHLFANKRSFGQL